MPLTEFQRQVFGLIAANRSPESHVIGATVINASPGTPRYSRDIDICHDVAASVASSEELDAKTLELLPAETLGSCFLDERGQPTTPDPTIAAFSTLRAHRGTVGGTWPRISGG